MLLRLPLLLSCRQRVIHSVAVEWLVGYKACIKQMNERLWSLCSLLLPRSRYSDMIDLTVLLSGFPMPV